MKPYITETRVGILVFVVVLTLAVGGVSPALAQSANTTANNTTAVNETVMVPTTAQPSVLVPNGSNNTTSNTTLPAEALPFARQLVNMTPAQARQTVRENPNKTAELARALQRLGVGNATQRLRSRPIETLRPFVAVANADDVVGGGGGGWLPDIDPVGWMQDLIMAGINAVTRAVANLVDRFNWLMLSLPAPGDVFRPRSWFPGFASPIETPGTDGSGVEGGSTDGSSGEGVSGTLAQAQNTSELARSGPLNLDGWWRATWAIYAVLAVIFGLPLIIEGIQVWSENERTARQRDERLREIGRALGLIIVGPLVLPLVLHTANLFSIAFAPSGAEFMSTYGGAAKLLMGLVVAVPLLAVKSVIIVIALFVLFVQWVMMFFIVATWPLYCSCIGSRYSSANAVGRLGFSAFGILIFLKWFQSLWLRFLFSLPLDFSVGGLLTVVATIVGLAIAFIGLPIKGTEKASPQTVLLGARETNKRTPDADEVRSLIARRADDDEED